MKATRCRDCTAAVGWVKTTTGSKMPVDFEPVRFGGNVELFDPEASEPLAAVLRKGESRSGTLYRSHFVTCPAAAVRRKKRGRSATGVA